MRQIQLSLVGKSERPRDIFFLVGFAPSVLWVQLRWNEHPPADSVGRCQRCSVSSRGGGGWCVGERGKRCLRGTGGTKRTRPVLREGLARIKAIPEDLCKALIIVDSRHIVRVDGVNVGDSRLLEPLGVVAGADAPVGVQ